VLFEKKDYRKEEAASSGKQFQSVTQGEHTSTRSHSSGYLVVGANRSSFINICLKVGVSEKLFGIYSRIAATKTYKFLILSCCFQEQLKFGSETTIISVLVKSLPVSQFKYFVYNTDQTTLPLQLFPRPLSDVKFLVIFFLPSFDTASFPYISVYAQS
jgi:hypothetical protein